MIFFFFLCLYVIFAGWVGGSEGGGGDCWTLGFDGGCTFIANVPWNIGKHNTHSQTVLGSRGPIDIEREKQILAIIVSRYRLVNSKMLFCFAFLRNVP